jgi:hypothetical protein
MTPSKDRKPGCHSLPQRAAPAKRAVILNTDGRKNSGRFRLSRRRKRFLSDVAGLIGKPTVATLFPGGFHAFPDNTLAQVLLRCRSNRFDCGDPGAD